MKYIAFDTETDLIRPGALAPELACLSYQIAGEAPRVVDRNTGIVLMARWLMDPEVALVGHNVAFDMAVIQAAAPDLVGPIFSAYDDGRITDTMIRAQLVDIAAGKFGGTRRADGSWEKRNYNLSDCHARAGFGHLEKDQYRMRYGLLRWQPFDSWPEGARRYAADDAAATMRVFLSQGLGPVSPDEANQARAAYALHLMAAWGMRTEPRAVEALRLQVEIYLEELKATLMAEGLVRADGSRDTKAATARMRAAILASGGTARLTPVGAKAVAEGVALADLEKGWCLDEDACEASGDPVLETYARYTKQLAVLSKDIPLLLSGSRYPIHTRFGLAESGRTTSSSPNLQNLSSLPGIRECFHPRDGWVYCNADYDQLELRTLAQVCLRLFGFSRLAEVLNRGLDPHTILACTLAGIASDGVDKEDPRVAAPRKLAKVANFGFPGGMGAKKIVQYAANRPYKLTIPLGDAFKLRNTWMATWPEVPRLFAHTEGILNSKAPIEQLFSRRLRLTDSYTAANNTWFQGLGADATKNALWLITRACYADVSSPLFGCRPVNYVHDEFIVEAPEGRAPEAAEELARLMKRGADKFLPDVPTKTDPLLMREWSKKAKTVRDKDGRLVVWGDKEAA